METPVKREGRPSAAAAAGAAASGHAVTFGTNQFSAAEADRITEMLDRKLSRQDVATRVGSGNARFTYLEGHRAVEITNAVFGFNGWSDNISDVTVDFCDEDRGKFNVGISAIVRVTLRDGTYHEDIGYGLGTNPRKGEALEKAKKEAITDARKRALRLFGNALGNSLYDKGYLAELAQGKGAQEPVIDRKRKREATESASPGPVPASPAGSTFIPSGSASSPMLPPPPRAAATPASPAAAGSGAGGALRSTASPVVPPYSPMPAAPAAAASLSHAAAALPFSPAAAAPVPMMGLGPAPAAASSSSASGPTPLAPAGPAAAQFKLSPPRPHQAPPAPVAPAASPVKPPQSAAAAAPARPAAAAAVAPAPAAGGRAQFHAPANAKPGVQFGGRPGAPAAPATKSPQKPQPLVVFPPGQQQAPVPLAAAAAAAPNGAYRPAAAAAAAPAASQIPASLPSLEPQMLGPGPAGPASLSPAAPTVGFASASTVMTRGDSVGSLSQGVGDEALNSLMDQVDATESQASKRLRTA